MRPVPLALSLVLSLASALAGDLDLVAANPAFPPSNQLRISGNACGPAALLTAFGSGTAPWQELVHAIPAKEDRMRLSYIIRGYGSRPSNHLDRKRWNRGGGIGLADLTDIANEMKGKRWLPKVRHQVLLQQKSGPQHKLLKLAHARLEDSFRKGLPPIISLQRLAYRKAPGAEAASWQVVHGHFVTVVAMPRKLSRRATSFRIRYADPWGGRVAEGIIRTNDQSGYPALLAEVPSSEIGKDRLKPGERSMVVLSAALGVW